MRACLCDSATASRKIRQRKTARARGGGVERHGGGEEEKEEGEKDKSVSDWRAGHASEQHPFLSPP